MTPYPQTARATLYHEPRSCPAPYIVWDNRKSAAQARNIAAHASRPEPSFGCWNTPLSTWTDGHWTACVSRHQRFITVLHTILQSRHNAAEVAVSDGSTRTAYASDCNLHKIWARLVRHCVGMPRISQDYPKWPNCLNNDRNTVTLIGSSRCRLDNLHHNVLPRTRAWLRIRPHCTLTRHAPISDAPGLEPILDIRAQIHSQTFPEIPLYLRGLAAPD